MREIVICEDVEIERSLLHAVLQQYFQEINEEVVIQEYEAGEALVADVEEGYTNMELLFLDIYMKELNGMETARKLRELKCKVPIVFLTASPDFAVESYEVQASGYLLKPFEEEKLKKLLNQILHVDMKRRIAVKQRRQYRYIYLDDICYIESYRHSITLHLEDGTQVCTTEKMGEMEERLHDCRFLRCHQSYLVNMDYIADVREDIILRDGTEVPIRVRGKREIIDTYYAYFREHSGEGFLEA